MENLNPLTARSSTHVTCSGHRNTTRSQQQQQHHQHRFHSQQLYPEIQAHPLPASVVQARSQPLVYPSSTCTTPTPTPTSTPIPTPSLASTPTMTTRDHAAILATRHLPRLPGATSTRSSQPMPGSTQQHPHRRQHHHHHHRRQHHHHHHHHNSINNNSTQVALSNEDHLIRTTYDTPKGYYRCGIIKY